MRRMHEAPDRRALAAPARGSAAAWCAAAAVVAVAGYNALAPLTSSLASVRFFVEQ